MSPERTRQDAGRFHFGFQPPASLVSALAKLAVPEGSHLLRAGAASLLSHRVARLTSSEPQGTNRAADWLLIAVFGGILLACVLGTIAHNPSCFKVRI